MTPVFIFAEHVQKLLESGENEIQIPAGARVSAAAYDLIRDKKIRVIHVAAGNSAADTEMPPAENNPVVAEESRAIQGRPASGKGKNETPPDTTVEISEDMLEDIIERVIERVRQAKGARPTAAGSGSGPGTDGVRDDDLVICRCEEITRGEIKEAVRNGMQTLNGVKRVTRAGMGLCQGQTCQRLVAQILTEELGLATADIDPTTARGPVRPLRLEVFANS